MSDAIRLEIRLEKSTAEFTPGEAITGRIRVSAEEAWDVRQFNVALYWKTAGIGTQDSGTAVAEEIARQGARISTTGEYRFQLTAPPMPWTYHGTLLKIQWYLRIEARGTKRRQHADFEQLVTIRPRQAQASPPPPMPDIPPAMPRVPIPDAPPE